MAVHGRDELEREGRLIRANMRASLMSDSKWRKLLSALDRPELKLNQCIIKFVGVLDEKVVNRPSALYPPRPWVDTIEFGPIPLRSIEWMLFPRVPSTSAGIQVFQNNARSKTSRKPRGLLVPSAGIRLNFQSAAS